MASKVEAGSQVNERSERRALRAMHSNYRASMVSQDGALLDQFSQLLSQVAEAVKGENFKADLKEEAKNSDRSKHQNAAASPASKDLVCDKPAIPNQNCEAPAEQAQPEEFHTQEQPTEEIPEEAPEGETELDLDQSQELSAEKDNAEPVSQEVPESEYPSCPTPPAAETSATQVETEAAALATQQSTQELPADEAPKTDGPAPEHSAAPVTEQGDQAVAEEVATQPEVQSAEAEAPAAETPNPSNPVAVNAKPEPKVDAETKPSATAVENRAGQQAVQVQQDVALRNPDSDQFELHQQIAEKLIEHIQEKLAKSETQAAAVAQRAQPFSELRNVLALGVSAEGLLTSELKISTLASSSNALNALELGRAKGIEALKPAQAPNAQLNNSPFAQKAQPASELQGEAPKNSKQTARAEIQKSLDRVQATIKEVERSKDGKTISLRLDPPNLGVVKVDVSYRDANLHARIVAEAPKVAQLLRDKLGEIQQMLRDAGINADSVSVSIGGGSVSSGREQGSNGKEAAAHPGFSALIGASAANFGSSKLAQGKKEVADDHWVA